MIKKKLISLDLNLLTYQQAKEWISSLAENHFSSYVCFANVHMLIEAYRSTSIKEYINKATLIVTDGVPLILAVRYLFGVSQERIAGMDMMPDLLTSAQEKHLKVAFYGGSEDVKSAMLQKLTIYYPDLEIGPFITPPFRKLSPKEQQSYLDELNNSGAQLIFVSLGCPKQEIWMAQHSQSIQAVLLGVGGAFSVFAGLKPRAPIWMRKWALEWLFRLIQEPNRMFMRYVFTNSFFMILMLKEWISIKIIRK
jgi:N-acetylglucosaminyldiphosphoundecaprenol N-acetyl-beta-D-mannosaminyltransferase